MAKREAAMLAQKYDPIKHKGAFLWSIKYDGMRATWDGGITRGKHVPWTERVATGLWSRDFNPIYAPDWWLDQLPKVPLDGELWIGPNTFQTLMSTCKRLVPDDRWKQVKYNVLERIGLDTLYAYGKYDGRGTTIDFSPTLRTLLQRWAAENEVPWSACRVFLGTADLSDLKLPENTLVLPVQHSPWELSMRHTLLPELLEQGHEGIVLRRVGSIWTPARSNNLLKLKPWIDSEATVVGCTFGRSTDKGSKLLGMMGALIVSWNGRRFKLSGFTDAERLLCGPMADVWGYAANRPDEESDGSVMPVAFPLGSKVTFKYRELSDDGVPKEARYWRKY